MTITDAPNTYNNAIEILYQKGYEVFLLDKDEDYLIYMKKNEEVTVANDPLSLLAISYLKENGKIVDESWEDKFMDNFSALAIKEILIRKYSIKITDKHSDWYDWIVKKKDEMSEKITTVKELLTEFVTINVEKFNEGYTENDIVPYLTDKKINDLSDAGKISFGVDYNEQKQDLEKAIENTLQSYEDGIYRVFVNDEEMGEIDCEINLKENDELTFVRLTMLAGRMW